MRGASIRVLLVDRDEGELTLVRNRLDASGGGGFHLERVRTYEEGREALRRGEHDVYLIADRLGERSGLDLLKEAVAGNPHVPVLLLTSEPSPQAEGAAKLAGAADSLSSSDLGGPLLERSIRHALELKQAQRALQEAKELTERRDRLADMSEGEQDQVGLQNAKEFTERRERLADIGAITAQIVHDIGNPVAGIVMQANSILRSLDRDPPPSIDALRRQVDRVLNTSRALDGLVKGFLDVSREQRLTMRMIHLPDFLLDVSSAWQALAAQRAISLAVALEGVLPPLPGDVDKLRRVFENLVKNALEAIDRGPGKVTIRASCPDPSRVRISVEDTGPGVPPGMDPFRLFETTKQQGTGLGLAIVNQIVQAHEGSITFSPNKPSGAIFRVELPCRPVGK